MNSPPHHGTPTPDLALAARDLRKAYRLYGKPLHKFLDVFGLCPRGGYSEHLAVDGVNLEFARGEKVAIIGRNGAGKSTLLKLITETIRPTSGTVEVNGRVSALLQIGTGFHPDFTGRQNVYSGFAHAGLTGSEADGVFERVVDFAEIEEFIDQPMKTYSTGMAARLMFSAATALVPEILIVDEVLGIGDAYFSHKSFEHMRRMCAKYDTTLLLVTHDLYSAMNICDRFIWIDRGRVRADGDARSTLDAYEHSIKEQEEERLRLRNRRANADRGSGVHDLRLRVASRNGFALATPLALGRITLESDGGDPIDLEVAEGRASFVLNEDGNLGPPREVEGRACRTLWAHGSIYHHAEWAVHLPRPLPVSLVTVEYRYEGPDGVDLSLHSDDGRRLLRAPLPPTDGWETIQLPAGPELGSVPAAEGRASESEESGRQYGTGQVRIGRVRFVGDDGRDLVSVSHGASLSIEVEGAVESAEEREQVTWLVGFSRPGVALGTYVHRAQLRLPGSRRFVVRTRLERLLLGSGEWLVTVGVGAAKLFGAEYNPYFTVNDRWYHFIPRGQTLHVESTDSVDSFAYFVHPAEVSVESVAVEADSPGRSGRE